jgi:hypothetical protein
MKFLDVRALCMARIVCKHLCRSASGHIKALHPDCTALEQPVTSNFSQLSVLTHLMVSLRGKARLHLLGHSKVASLVTHVHLPRHGPDTQGTEGLSQLMLLPKLRSLTLQAELHEVDLVPLSLEELYLMAPIQQNVASLARFTCLTTLGIKLRAGAGQSLGSLACLDNLRSLLLSCGVSALRALREFTMLTRLLWNVQYDSHNQGNIFNVVGGLTGLSELKLLNLGRGVTRDHLARLSVLTGLTHLEFNNPVAAHVAGSSVLVPLTRLVSLGFGCVLAFLFFRP